MYVPFADRFVRICGMLLVGAAALNSAPAAAQTAESMRQVVSKSVSVGADASALRLEFAEGPALEIRLENGDVRIDGEAVDRYTPGGSVWQAWRGLLGFAVSLDDGPLGRALTEWSPPENLTGEELTTAELLDRTLEEALALPPVPAPDVPTAPRAPGAVGEGSNLEIGSLTALLGRRDRLPGLAEALEGLEIDELSLTVGEDRVVPADVELDATLVVVEGDLELDGTVRGDVVVVGGDLRLGPDARVLGEIRLADGELLRQGGEVTGGVRVVDVAATSDAQVDDLRESLREELRDEFRSEFRAATRDRDRRGPGPMGQVFDTIGSLIANLFSIIVLGVVGALVLHFAGPNLDAVAETARRTPGRALAVGTAGAFLLLPAWVIGILVLAVSIIGIPALILWIPLFPAAAVLAGGFGYVAVARNVGIWLTRQDYPYTGWVRITNPVTLIMGGALVLSAGYIAANLVGVLPFTGALEVLLAVSSTLLTGAAILIGFGSVLLTRGGRRPEFRDDDLFGGFGDPWSWSRPSAETSDPEADDEDLDVGRTEGMDRDASSPPEAPLHEMDDDDDDDDAPQEDPDVKA